MNRLFPVFLAAWVFATSLAGAEPAAVPRALGLQLSLVTELAHFDVPPDATATASAPQPRLRVSAVRSGSFAASVALTNFGRSPVALSYANSATLAARVEFSLLDAAGTVVWSSADPVILASGLVVDPPPAAVSYSLPPRATLRRTVQIPLKTAAGAWLPAGRYTVRADVGQGDALAQVPLEVAAALAPPPPDGTGLQGQVFWSPSRILRPILPQPVTGLASSSGLTVLGSDIAFPAPLPAQATIDISEIREPGARYDRPPFQYSGLTDEHGNFKVATPAGRFHLLAHIDGIIEPESFAPRWATVIVFPGQFTTQNYTIYGMRQSVPPGTLVLSVETATAQATGGPAGTLHIVANGHVSTTGWTQPRLVQHSSALDAIAIEAGELALDFVATPPPGLAGDVVLPIKAETTVPNAGPYTKVRVYSASGSVLASFVLVPD